MEWTWTDLWWHYKYVFTLDITRYIIAASLSYFIIWQLFGKLLQHRYIQKKRPGLKQHWHELRYSVSSVAIYAIVGVGIFIGVRSGAFNIYRDTATYPWWISVAGLIGLILWHDLYFYWTHKWMHHPKLYRHIHKVHHKSVSPSPWTAYSFHPFEAIIQALFIPIFLFVFPIHGLALFIFMVYQIARNVVGHLGYELFHNAFITSKWLNWITTTTHHDQHHHYFNHNYGLYFTWWDKWMKTEHPKYAEEFMDVKARKSYQHKRNSTPATSK
ncbi:MAG: sterol desaturase family protein [Roseivirga sp.]|nr:sterol desaturase family protein [Roseivirga sp.]